MTKYSDSRDIDKNDFEVLPASTAKAVEIFEVLATLKTLPRKSGLLQRKSNKESDTQFLITTAVNMVEMTTTLYRKNDAANPILSAAWLSLINEKAKQIMLTRQVPAFSRLTEDALRTVARQSRFVDQMKYLSTALERDYGVLLIYEHSFPGMKTDGCTFRLSNGTPVIGMSLRYNRYDYFWFTLLHELSHIALHYDYLDEVIFDNLEIEATSEVEVEANRMASEALIPRNIWRKLLLHKTSLEHIVRFAQDAEIHPSIAAGMVRNNTNNFSIYSDIVNAIDLKGELGMQNA